MLKRTKKSGIDGHEKKVIESLIDTKRIPRKREEKHELIRCKVDIYDDFNKKNIIDTFVINTTSLENTVTDIVQKYGQNVQFIITNLYDEKIIARRFTFTG